MTARPFTPRDAALDLGRRTQLVHQSLTTRSTGHPLDIARAVRSLAAARGSDPSQRAPVEWPPYVTTTFPVSRPASSPTSSSTSSPPEAGLMDWFQRLLPPSGSPYEHLPPLDPSPSSGKKEDGRYPWDEQLPPISDWQLPAKEGQQGGWERNVDPADLLERIRRHPPGDSTSTSIGNGGFQFPFPPGPAQPRWPAGVIAENPNSRPPLPGQSMPKPDSRMKPGEPLSPGSSVIKVQLDVIPRALRDELQKIAGAADRALREFRQVCAMTGTGRRR